MLQFLYDTAIIPVRCIIQCGGSMGLCTAVNAAVTPAERLPHFLVMNV